MSDENEQVVHAPVNAARSVFARMTTIRQCQEYIDAVTEKYQADSEFTAELARLTAEATP